MGSSKGLVSTMNRCVRLYRRSVPERVEVHLPGSKSITNRALLMAALARGRTSLGRVLDSDDTRHMARALQSLGVDVAWDEDESTATIVGGDGHVPRRAGSIFVGNAGTAARFLTVALSLWPGSFRLDGVARMRSRPIAPLLTALRALGGQLTGTEAPDCIPLQIEGGHLRGGDVCVPGDVSSQYLSGLLLASPYMEEGLRLSIPDVLVSRPYVEMTVKMMESFGVEVGCPTPLRFEVAAGQRYLGRAYEIEPDASGASYFFAVAALTGARVQVHGLSRTSMQGDLRFVEILERMGCQVEWGPTMVAVQGPAEQGQLRGVEVDMRDCSDVAQTLAVVAAFATSPTRITGIGFIRGKETDRVGAVVRELQRLGVHAAEEPDGMSINPTASALRPARIQTYEDHRMAMSFALAGFMVEGVELQDPDCVAKTFPDFFDRMLRLGLGVEEC